MPADEFKSQNIEFYRTAKIPSTGHFITDDDKAEKQISLNTDY